mgnify:CR=1 FL=1
MRLRKAFQYPPYVYMTLITISHENKAYVIQIAQDIAQVLMKWIRKDSIILGPTPSPIARMKDKFRYQLMVKYRNEPDLTRYLKKILTHYSDAILKNDIQISIDMEPYQLM